MAFLQRPKNFKQLQMHQAVVAGCTRGMMLLDKIYERLDTSK
jgi:hypothetical protein